MPSGERTLPRLLRRGASFRIRHRDNLSTSPVCTTRSKCSASITCHRSWLVHIPHGYRSIAGPVIYRLAAVNTLQGQSSTPWLPLSVRVYSRGSSPAGRGRSTACRTVGAPQDRCWPAHPPADQGGLAPPDCDSRPRLEDGATRRVSAHRLHDRVKPTCINDHALLCRISTSLARPMSDSWSSGHHWAWPSPPQARRRAAPAWLEHDGGLAHDSGYAPDSHDCWDEKLHAASCSSTHSVPRSRTTSRKSWAVQMTVRGPTPQR